MQRQTQPARASFLIAAVVATVPILAVACERRLSVAECESLWSSAEGQLTKVVAQHAACVHDEDCELVQQPNGCLWACKAAISRSGHAAYKAGQTRLQGEECAEWHRGGCDQTTPKPVPSCPDFTARCQGERCTAVYEPSR